jgi:hypothetical protein
MSMGPVRSSGFGGPLMAEALLGPAVVPALVVLVVNDHVLKVRWPGIVTGKLSDAAGLVILPVVLVAMIEGIRIVFRSQHPTARGRELALAACLSAAAFTAVKTSAWVAAAYSDALGWVQWPVRSAAALVTGGAPPGHSPVTVLADPSDLLALPAIAIGVLAAQRASRTPRWRAPAPRFGER